MNSLRIQPRRLHRFARLAGACTLFTALAACTSHTTTGAILNPGESAFLHLTGSPVKFEIANTGDQPLDYTLSENGVVTSRGSVGPGGLVAESRHAHEIMVTITNPGPDLAHASVQTSSRGGMEFHQPAHPQPDW